MTLVLLAVLGGLGVFSLNSTVTSFFGYAQIGENRIKVAEITGDYINLRRNIFIYATTGNEQALAQAKEAAPRLQKDVAATAAALTGERAKMLEAAGQNIAQYLANFEIAVTNRAARDKEYALLAASGLKAAASISQIVKGSIADGDHEMAAVAGQVQESLLLARLVAAAFVNLRDPKLIESFKQNYDTYRTAMAQLVNRLKNPERQRLAMDSTELGAGYARTFAEYSAKISISTSWSIRPWSAKRRRSNRGWATPSKASAVR